MTPEEPALDRQRLLVRILAIPLVPFVALWEVLRAIWRWTGRALRWAVSLPFRLIATLAGWLVSLLSALWHHVLGPLVRAVGRATGWLAGRLAIVLLPILLRMGILIRELAHAIWIAVRAVGRRLLVPLRLLGRLALQALRRALLILRLALKAVWLVLKAVLVRVSIPLRVLSRALARGMRWLGSTLWRWFLVPLGRALSAAFRAARWMVRGALRGLARVLIAVYNRVRPALALALRAVMTTARAAWAALRVTWSAAHWLFSPVARVWRVATTLVGAALRRSIEAVRRSAWAARVAVREAFHDARNAVRAAFGRRPLPAPVMPRTAPRRKQSPHHVTHPSSSPSLVLGIAGFALVAVIIGVLVVGLASTPRSPAPSLAAPVGVTDRCPLLQPAGPVALSIDASCGTLGPGRTLVGLHCWQIDRLPASVALQTYQGEALDSSLPTKATFDGDGCHLQVSPKREGELSTAGTLPRDILVIADFTAPAGVLFDLGVFGRCGASGCVDTAVEGDGSTFMSEREGGGRWLDLTRRRLKILPGLNRLVLWVGGAVAVAWLNGAEMGRPDVTGGGNGGVAGFYFINREQAALDVTVRQLAFLDLN